MKFREINKREYRILKGLNDEFGLDIGSAFREKKIIVSTNGRRLKKLKKGVYSAGLFIGEIRKKFVLGLEGGSLIARHSKKKIFVSDMAEQLVLYGKDVFFNSILKGRKKMKSLSG